jgi:hypothetical protein
MSTPARVLLIGNEVEHLMARAAVLHHFWVVDVAALEESDVPVFSADLVVVCHTLPEGERQQWVMRVRQQVPTMLIVRMNGFDSGPHAGADATVNVHNGPGALVSTIYELLTERGLDSREWPVTAYEAAMKQVQ